MKILHFIDCLRSGGKERQLVELLKGLSEQKDIVCELAIMSEDIHYSALKNIGIKTHYLIRKNKKDPRILLKLYTLCKEFKPDIIHSWDSMTSVYAFPIARVLRIKFVNGLIRDAPSKLKFFGKAWNRSKLTFAFSDVILANSIAGLKSYNATQQKSYYIHNGFDFKRIKMDHDQTTVKRKYSINTDKVVGMVASFTNNKDYETFISAAQMILQEKSDITFLAIGDGEKLDKCKKLVKPQNKRKIKFLGKQNDIESIVNVFDIGILATDTRFHGEGISNSIMEYMVLGKPVLATDSGGTKELVINGKTGFLLKPLDAKDMYTKTRQLLENQSLTIKMGKAGKERIYSSFSLKIMSNSFVNLYENVLNENSFNYTFP